MTPDKMQMIIEAALMVAGEPLTLAKLQHLFQDESQTSAPSQDELLGILNQIQERYESRGINLQLVASGYRLQANAELSPWLGKLWEERPARYSRAFLETLSIIAYKQPITRAEIEAIRSVAVSTSILKSLLERDWVKVIGHRDLPGKPALYATTKLFLDHFNLKTLTDLPSLAEFKNLQTQETQLQVQLALENSETMTEIKEERDHEESIESENTLEESTENN